MALRLYLYMGQLWDSQRREWEAARTPARGRRLRPVIPLVFYTGTRTWHAPLRLAELMDVPSELERFVPAWETLLLPLHGTASETLTHVATAVGWALRVLQSEQAARAELERVLAEAMAGLEGLPEEQADQWLRAAWYLVLLVFHRRPESDKMRLMARLWDQARESKFRLREELQAMERTYAQAVEASPQAAYITTRHPPLDERLRAGFQALGVSFEEKQIGDFHIFYALSRKVIPEELGLGSDCCSK